MEFTDHQKLKNSTKRSISKQSGLSIDQDNQSAGNGFMGSEQLSGLNSNSNRQLQQDENQSGNNMSNNDQKTNPEAIENELIKSDDE